MIHDIHCEFKHDAEKIVKVTTDNVSNMVKAFSMFSQNNQINDLDNNDSDDNFIIQGITEMTEGIASDSNSISEIFLSVHQRLDIKAALTGSSGKSYIRSYHSAFGKSAETYVAITGMASSSFVGTQPLINLNDLITVKQFLGSVCDAFELSKFKDTDLEFLATRRKNCFYGELLPVLLQTQKKLQKLQFRHLKYCAKLIVVLLEGLNKRFSYYLNLKTICKAINFKEF
ncbi:hypothetical protein ACFW04_014007 [Cataglyphis niger]